MRPTISLPTPRHQSYAGWFCLIVIAALLTAGCSGDGNGNASNSSTANSAAKTPETKTATASPSEAFKAFIAAAQKNDALAISKLVSRNTVKMLADQAAKNNQSLDEYIKAQNKDSNVTTQDIEVVSEKINGDNATVEYKQRGDKLAALLVKEDGQWKIAYDKMMEQMEKEMETPAKK